MIGLVILRIDILNNFHYTSRGLIWSRVEYHSILNYLWEQKINQARWAEKPLKFPKNEVGDIPRDFERIPSLGLAKKYKADRGHETITIQVGPINYSVSVEQRNSTFIEPGRSTTIQPQGQGRVIVPPSNGDNDHGVVIAALLLIAGIIALIVTVLVGIVLGIKRLITSPTPTGSGVTTPQPSPTPTPKSTKTYELFISHSWDYDEQYERLKKLLEDNPSIEFVDISIPKDKPLEISNNAELASQLKNKISQSSAVIIISGMYTSYSNWIRAEMNIAKELGKPIIGVKPWGNEQLPKKVQEDADEIVGWNAQSIVDAVRRHTR